MTLSNSVKQNQLNKGKNSLTKDSSQDKPLKRLNANIDADLFNEFKAAVSAKGQKLNEAIVEMVNEYLGKKVKK